MFGWVKRILRIGAVSEQEADRAKARGSNDDLLVRFEKLLSSRLVAVRPEVLAGFEALFAARYPDDVAGIHIEVFLDVEPFSFRAYEMSAQNVLTEEHEPTQNLNRLFDGVEPILSQDEMDAFYIWEEYQAEDGQVLKQHALEQPLDAFNVPGFVLPWLRDVVAQARGTSTLRVTGTVHDLTSQMDL